MKPSFGETDVIAAIATPLGEGGLAVIRISGTGAFAIAERIFQPAGAGSILPSSAPTHTLHYGHIVRDGRRVDEVLLGVMRAPRTFTREDVAEISCHGGVFVVRQVLDTVLAAGARLAQPGEFTRRAFLNGRLDLAQAEAVSDLIQARTELALAAANEQLAGALSRRVNALRDALMLALAHIEAHIDFPEEDIAPETRAGLERRLKDGLCFMDELIATAREGQVLRRGVRAAIVGRPNVGKSSLLNQLLGRDRAIVSAVAGTTRDTIEETANIRGIPVVFVDTAGLRSAADQIEQEGIRRTHAAVAQAEIILHVLDRSDPLTEVDRGYLREFATKPRIVVFNKTDLPARVDSLEHPPESLVSVSCLSGTGIEDLKTRIVQMVGAGTVGSGMLEASINARHEDALRRARAAADRTLEALRDGLSLELVALDLRIAVQAVGEIVGKTATEDLLDAIFTQFCLGK